MAYESYESVAKTDFSEFLSNEELINLITPHLLPGQVQKEEHLIIIGKKLDEVFKTGEWIKTAYANEETRPEIMKFLSLYVRDILDTRRETVDEN